VIRIREAILSARIYMLYIAGALFILYLCSGIFAVPQTQIGVHQRFGRIINPDVKPGIHYSMPWPIDTVNKVPVKNVMRISIDDFSGNLEEDSQPYLFYELTGLNSYCISGDNNIVNIGCVIQYRVSNPVDYLFRVKNNEELFKGVISNTIIKCLAGFKVDEILTYGKREIENIIKSETQEKLETLKCGLMISFVELRDVRPPQDVQSNFDDVINAKIDKRKIISQAESYRNENIPQAKGQAMKMVEEAGAYKDRIISKAEGETQRFLEQLKDYQARKEITKKRLYIEFVKKNFTGIEKVYLIDTRDNKPHAQIRLLSNY